MIGWVVVSDIRAVFAKKMENISFIRFIYHGMESLFILRLVNQYYVMYNPTLLNDSFLGCLRLIDVF